VVLGRIVVVEDECGYQEADRPWIDFEGFENPDSNFDKLNHAPLVVAWVDSRPLQLC